MREGRKEGRWLEPLTLFLQWYGAAWSRLHALQGVCWLGKAGLSPVQPRGPGALCCPFPYLGRMWGGGGAGPVLAVVRARLTNTAAPGVVCASLVRRAPGLCSHQGPGAV
jgi:hypothetical protein